MEESSPSGWFRWLPIFVVFVITGCDVFTLAPEMPPVVSEWEQITIEYKTMTYEQILSHASEIINLSTTLQDYHTTPVLRNKIFLFKTQEGNIGKFTVVNDINFLNESLKVQYQLFDATGTDITPYIPLVGNGRITLNPHYVLDFEGGTISQDPSSDQDDMEWYWDGDYYQLKTNNSSRFMILVQ